MADELFVVVDFVHDELGLLDLDFEGFYGFLAVVELVEIVIEGLLDVGEFVGAAVVSRADQIGYAEGFWGLLSSNQIFNVFVDFREKAHQTVHIVK